MTREPRRWHAPCSSPVPGVTMEGMTVPQSTPTTVVEPEVEQAGSSDVPWQAIVWNDPVNLMSYVTYVFQKVFGYPEPKATALMLDVHHKGKAAVSSGDKDKVEGDVGRRREKGRGGGGPSPSCTLRACGPRCRRHERREALNGVRQ